MPNITLNYFFGDSKNDFSTHQFKIFIITMSRLHNICRISVRLLSTGVVRKNSVANVRECANLYGSNFQSRYKGFWKNSRPSFAAGAFLAFTVLKWLGFEKDDEEKESELIMTLKRAVLCMYREEYDKSEQMLHLALRLAQQQQNSKGILYCFDLMANLAMERAELQKAEKLFVSVMQLMLSTGEKEDDIKVIFILYIIICLRKGLVYTKTTVLAFKIIYFVHICLLQECYYCAKCFPVQFKCIILTKYTVAYCR